MASNGDTKTIEKIRINEDVRLKDHVILQFASMKPLKKLARRLSLNCIDYKVFSPPPWRYYCLVIVPQVTTEAGGYGTSDAYCAVIAALANADTAAILEDDDVIEEIKPWELSPYDI